MGKMLFLVSGVVVKQRYMCDADEGIEVSHLVSARNALEAEVMFCCYYERMSSSYDVSYCVYYVEASETISLILSKEEEEKFSYKLQ